LCKKVNNIFRDIKDSKFKPEIFIKDTYGRFTSVDWIVQKLLENYLKIHFPRLKFVGEEDTSQEDFIKSDYLTIDNISFDFDENLIAPEFRELPIENLCLFVDPIDSTGQLIKGKYEPVTTLIGLTYNCSPLFGIIHFPLYKDKYPLCLLNIPGNGVYQYDFEKYEKIIPIKNDSINFIVGGNKYKDLVGGKI
jgi:3'-phosphoadenosine 5'-phosphosulfate (PAPS) 3'-phosphatase